MAQEANIVNTNRLSISSDEDSEGFFNHLDIAASVGTTGVGIELAAPVGKYFRMRTGFSYMPRVELTSSFRVQVGDTLDKKWDAHGNRLQTKFDKLSGYLKDLVGYDIDDEVEMLYKPTYFNYKLLVDFFPFRDKRWYITAGFFAGPSEIARAYNTTEEMPSLLSVSMWNMMYDKAKNGEPFYGDARLPEEIEAKLLSYGRLGFHAGNHLKNGPYLYDDNVFPVDFSDAGEPIYAFDENNNPIFEKVMTDSEGKPVRAYRKGDPNMMVPDPSTGLVTAVVKVNRFKPYLGLGFGGAVSKDQRTYLSVDAGCMFWGGTPSMITHDGVNLTKDVEDVQGKLGRYVRMAKFMKAFPVLELRISRRIF